MMKKLFFLVPVVCVLCEVGCAGFSRQPVFTDIIGEEAEPLKIAKTVRMENNTVQMYFAGTAEFISAEIFIPETGEAQTCSIESIDIPNDFNDSEGQSVKTETCTAFAVIPAAPISIGVPFVLRGSVSDTKHSVLDFALPFEGSNTRPAKLRITEIRPLYSSKPKSEFIEFIVMESGNLAGITITNVGDKQNPHYRFPAAEVSAGETVVYHWRSVEEGIRDELTVKTISGGTQACSAARDFWGPHTSLPKRNANVILIKTGSDGDIQDAVLYCTEKEFVKRSAAPAWNDEELVREAELAVASGVWRGEAVLKDAVIAPITASKSLVRSTKTGVNKADSWTLRNWKDVTMGKPY